MKKLALEIIALTIILAFINSNAFAQWQVDHTYGFKINVPRNWSKNSHMDGTDKIYDYNSPDQNAAVQLRVFEATPQVTVDLLCQAYESSYIPAGTQKVSLVDYTSVNGIPGKQGLYILNYNNTEVTIATFYTVQNNIGYVLSAMIPSGMVEQKGAELKQITHSFLIDGFEKTANIVQEEKKPAGLSGLLGKSTENNNLSGENVSSGNSFGSNQGANDGYSFVYEGQTYRTVKIGSQVWMADNLSVGKMVIADKYEAMQKDNNIIEYYAPKNDDQEAQKVGAYYTWNEMMQYKATDNANIGSTQGICPSGWHIPTDHEWNVLEAFVDSEFDLNSTNWNRTGNRGTDSGKKLKSRTGWKVTSWFPNPNGTDDYGFNMLPSGGSTKGIFFIDYGNIAAYWTATAQERSDAMAWKRTFEFRFDNVNRTNCNKQEALLVRCIKN
jgi:uncharacterized protein (TIGR02145 family)